jgi:ATP-binding cassette subfamily C protein
VFLKNFSSKEIKLTYSLLNNLDKIRLLVLFVSQLLLSFLDLIGIALFGLLGALAVNGVSYKSPGSRLLMVLRFLNLDNLDFRAQAGLLGVIATVILLLRTSFAILLTKKTIRFLGYKSTRVTESLFIAILNDDYQKIKNISNEEWVVSLTKGINSLTIRVIGGLITIFSDVFLLIIILIGLFIFNFQIALLTLLIFGGVGLAMYILIRQKAQHSGFKEQQLDLEINQKIVQSFSAFREIYLQSKQKFYGNQITYLRNNQVESQTISSFFPILSRYVFEAIVVVGTLIVGAIQFLLYDAIHAVATISVFMAASSRIAPAVMRIQQSSIVLKTSLGSSLMSLKVIEEYWGKTSMGSDGPSQQYTAISADLQISNLNFEYQDSQQPTLRNINLELDQGTSLAIVGPSGSGKSTLADLIIGVMQPQEGEILVGKIPVREFIFKFPGKISYVPQQVSIFNASISENVALDTLDREFSQERVWKALSAAGLADFVKQLPNQLDYVITERGKNLSGGQNQRLGIARALYTNPQILVLDEATSALDVSTEVAITDHLTLLAENITLIVIAHRLSTIKNADIVIYLKNGVIESKGSFEEVRNQIVDFDKQANLLGL